MSDDKGDNQLNKRVKLNPAIKMSIDRAPAILGHLSEGKTRETAAALGILITRGALKTCESCAISEARQKNVNEESAGVKAVKYNGRVYDDIGKMRKTSRSVERRCGTSQPKRQLTSREVNSSWQKATCQRTCVCSCNKRSRAGIQSRSSDRTTSARTRSWSRWLIQKMEVGD